MTTLNVTIGQRRHAHDIRHTATAVCTNIWGPDMMSQYLGPPGPTRLCSPGLEKQLGQRKGGLATGASRRLSLAKQSKKGTIKK